MSGDTFGYTPLIQDPSAVAVTINDDGAAPVATREQPWEDQLKHLSNSAISEAMLHKVPWDEVIKKFVVNLAAAVLPLGLNAAVKGKTLVTLPIFIMVTLLLVTTLELLAALPPLPRLCCRAAAGAMPIIGIMVYHSPFAYVLYDGHGPMAFVITLSKFTGCSWIMCSLVFVLFLFGDRLKGGCFESDGFFLNKSDCFNAVYGQRLVSLKHHIDIAKLIKSMGVTEKEYGWLEWLYYRCDPPITKQIVLGSVQVDETNPTVPFVPLEIDGQLLHHGEWRLDKLVVVYQGVDGVGHDDTGPQHPVDEPRRNPTQIHLELGEKSQMQAILKEKTFVPNEVLHDWLSIAYHHTSKRQSIETGGDISAVNSPTAETETGGEKVKLWFHKNKLHGERFTLVATATRIDRLEGLLEHWAIQALVMTAITAVSSLPARSFFADLFKMQGEICKDAAASVIHLAGGELLCSNVAECASLCSSPISFVEAVNSTLHTSYVEVLFIFVLIPIYVFIFSVNRLDRRHNSLENRYLKGMGGGRASIREVTQFKETWESMLKTNVVLHRFKRRFMAWYSTDPDLSAKSSFKSEASAGAKHVNGAFAYVVDHIASSASPPTVKKFELPYGLRGNGSDDYIAEACANFQYEWRELKHHTLTGSKMSFSVAFTVETDITSWNNWKSWLFDTEFGYGKQLVAIYNDPNAQDSGKGSHLLETVVVNDQAVPKGFSLVHIRATNPEFDHSHVIDISSILKAAKKHSGASKEAAVEALNHALRHIDKAALEDKQHGEDLDLCIELRFVLSEHYWACMPKYTKGLHSEATPEYKELTKCPNDPGKCLMKTPHTSPDGKWIPIKTFLDFVSNMLEPLSESELLPQKMRKYYQDSYDTSYLTVMMGGEDSFKPLAATGRILMERIWVILLCVLIMLIPPLFRCFVQGGKFFPQPFETCLAVNMFFSTIALWSFFSNFQEVTERLAILASALAGFEQKTINPSGTAAKGKSGKKNPGNSDVKTSASPFDFTVNAGLVKKSPESEDLIPRLYDPKDKEGFWKRQWNEKHDNVQNWHLCAGYIRVFVSSSRLTAQAILLAAGVILAFMIGLSLVQALQGKGVVAVNAEVLAGKVAGKALAHVSHAVNEQVDGARRLSMSLAKASIATGSGVGAGAFANVSIASEVLRQQMLPFREAADMAHFRRLGDMEQMMGKLQEVDASKITKTQFLTIAMVLILIFYSVPLLWHVAKINDCFDRHGSLLLAQKELHRTAMARREKERETTAVALTGAGEAGAGTADDPVAEASGVDAQAEKEDETVVAGKDATAKADDKHDKDLACRRFEKMLDMAMQVANKNKTRFPLKLFGFVINMALLFVWVGMAASPLAEQAQHMAPVAVKAGCNWLEHSALVEAADDMTAQVAEVAGKATHSSKTQQADFRKKFSIKKLVEDMLCKPLVKLAEKKAAELADALEHPGTLVKHAEKKAAELADALKHPGTLVKHAEKKAAELADALKHPGSRRLSALPALAPVVQTWWNTHPGDPYAKFYAVTQLLQDLERETSQEPQASPRQTLPSTDGEKTNTLDVNDLHSWLQRHQLPDSIKTKIQAEKIDTLAELAMLTEENVHGLCQGEKFGDQARVRLLVKAAQDASASSKAGKKEL